MWSEAGAVDRAAVTGEGEEQRTGKKRGREVHVSSQAVI